MTDHIENETLQVSVQRIGAELSSLKSKKTGTEYMWQANPEIWGSHAPVLFPVIGALKDDAFSFNNTIYKGLPKHGYIRRNENLRIDEHMDDRISYSLSYSEESLSMYPFKFHFSIQFMLEDNSLNIVHRVTNKGDEKMLFSLGAHPAFSCPRNSHETYEDYYLEFEQEETDHTWLLSNRGLIDKAGPQILDKQKILPLHKHLFDQDALIFKHLNSRLVHLKSKKSPEVLSISYPQFPYLGIWAKPAAPFVCIEPWMGIADTEESTGRLEEKEGILQLPAQEEFEANYRISISE